MSSIKRLRDGGLVIEIPERLRIATEIEALRAQVERANKRFAEILDCVDGLGRGDGSKTKEIEKIATRAMLECQGYPLSSDVLGDATRDDRNG